MSPTITFYDLASRQDPPKGWLFHTLKIRLLLNYLAVDYRTEWLDYQDIAPLFEAAGAAPLTTGALAYDVPALKIGDEYHIGDERCSRALQAMHPNTQLGLDDRLHAPIQEAMSNTMGHLRIVWMPLMLERLVTDRSAERFSKRKMAIAEAKGLLAAWSEAGRVAADLNGLLEQRGGRFALGDDISYSDFYIAAHFEFARLGDEAFFDKLLELIPRAQGIFHACEQYL